MGSSIAYHLKSDRNFDGEVVVVERDPTYARASSALSASSIRQQFSTPLNIHLSRYGIGFLRQASKLLDVDLGLKEPGYLFLASDAGEAVLRANHAVQKGEGCAVELLDPAALRGRFPWISDEGVRARLARHRQRRLVRRAGADAGLPPQGARARRAVRRRRGRGAGAQRGHPALGRHDRGPDHRDRRRPVVGRGRRHWPASRCRSSRAGARCSCSTVREPPGLTAAHHRSVGRLVPARGPLLHRRHDAGRGQRSAERAARGPAPGMGRHGVAGAGPSRAGLRGGQGGEFLGGLLRVQHLRPERHRRPPSGDRQPRSSPPASPATASSSRRRSAAPSPS